MPKDANPTAPLRRGLFFKYNGSVVKPSCTPSLSILTLCFPFESCFGLSRKSMEFHFAIEINPQ